MILLALALAIPAASAAKPKPELQCGVIPTADVVLSHDLTCGTVDGDGFALDLQGHTLTAMATNFAAIRSGTVDGDVERTLVLRGVHVTGRFAESGFGPPLFVVTQVRQSTIDGPVILTGGQAVFANDTLGAGISHDPDFAGIDLRMSDVTVTGPIDLGQSMFPGQVTVTAHMVG